MFLSLVLPLAVTTGMSWNAPPLRVPTDSRVPNAYEAAVLGAAFCNGRPNCNVKFQPIGINGQPVPVLGRLVPVSIVYGSFSRPNTQEVLLTLCAAQSDGCEGVALLRHERGQWKHIEFTPGITPRDCLRFRRADGRDHLACRSNEFVMYGARLSAVWIERKRAVQKTLLNADIEQCGKDVSWVTRLGEWRKEDVNGDGRPDLVVNVQRYRLSSNQPTCPPDESVHVEIEEHTRRWGM